MSSAETKNQAVPSRAGGVWWRATLLLVSVALALACAEAVLRIWPPRFYDDPLRQYHAVLGWTAKLGKVFYRLRGDGLVRFETNAIGFRDHEHSFQRQVAGPGGQPRPIRRIVVIGDSFTEAAQVELHLTFCSRLKAKLNAGKKVYWEVVNLGIGGWGTAQEMLALEDYGMAYRPDLVILQLFPLNDVVDNSLAAANLASPQDAYRPYLDPRTGFRTVTYLNPTTSWLRRRSAVCRYAFLALQKAFGPWGREMVFPDVPSQVAYVEAKNAELGWATGLDIPAEPILFNAFAAEKDQLDIVREGWAATEAAVDRIHHTATEGRARLIVMAIPHAHQLKPRFASRQKNLSFAADPKYAEARLEAHLAGRGVSLVALVDLFEANLPTVLPFIDGHLDVGAHDLVADMLAAEVARMLPAHFDPKVAAKLSRTAQRRRLSRPPERRPPARRRDRPKRRAVG